MTEVALLRRRRVRRPRVSVLGVIGELLITAGAIVMLYIVWQLWAGDIIIGAQRNAVGQERLQEWAAAAPVTPSAAPTAEPDVAVAPVAVEPVVLPEVGDGQIFGVMQVPRWGADYAVDIAGGVSREVTLDPIGIGHYPTSPMPGSVGNVALAAHRTTYGKPFNRIAELHVGDAIVITTPDGWYTYRFRTLQYVTPESVDVLLPVPQRPEVVADGRFLTLTSCSPMFSMTERIVGYSLFESFTPLADGPPASLAAPAGV